MLVEALFINEGSVKEFPFEFEVFFLNAS